jgi:hypothetical protein
MIKSKTGRWRLNLYGLKEAERRQYLQFRPAILTQFCSRHAKIIWFIKNKAAGEGQPYPVDQ